MDYLDSLQSGFWQRYEMSLGILVDYFVGTWMKMCIYSDSFRLLTGLHIIDHGILLDFPRGLGTLSSSGSAPSLVGSSSWWREGRRDLPNGHSLAKCLY